MNGSVIFLIFFVLTGIKSDVIIKDVTCINVEGTPIANWVSIATCPSTHILTGCGTKPTQLGNNAGIDQIKGTSIDDGDKCKAWTHGASSSNDDYILHILVVVILAN